MTMDMVMGQLKHSNTKHKAQQYIEEETKITQMEMNTNIEENIHKLEETTRYISEPKES